MQATRFLDTRMSILLDLVRGGSALAVLAGHAGQIGLFGNGWLLDDSFQHSAVVIFFVLSGLMIQQSASREGMTLGAFAKTRAARILPVSVFAIAFCSGMSAWLSGLAPPDSLMGNAELTR